MIFEIAGYLSGVVILLSFIPYIRDIFFKKTKPERASWFIWSLLGIIAFFSQLAKGASYSLIMTGAQAFGDLLVFILAIKFGLGGFSKRDRVALLGVGLSLLLWYLTNEAVIALFLVIFIDAIGVTLTVIKAYKKPETETISTWVLTSLAGLLALISVGKMDLIISAFPLYTFVLGIAIIIAAKLGMRKKINKI